MDRRALLAGLGCSLAASPLVTPVAFASAPWDARLVVIILRGAMDGLDTFRPIGDPNYAELRPDLNTQGALDLDGFWALHPAMAPLLPLWQRGEMGVVPAVSTPYRDVRSHFDGQDLLEAGGSTVGGEVRDGWLNRLLQVAPGMQAETAYAIGREPMQILAGAAEAARWSPEAKLRITPQAERLLGLIYESDPLFHGAAEEAIAIAAQVSADQETTQAVQTAMESDSMMGGTVPRGEHVSLAQFAAARLRGDTRIASFSLSGWDTHLGQAPAMDRALGRLSQTILTLRAGLGPDWEKTAVLCVTEFGRTARQNGTFGTDHGTGGAMIYAGGALKGGQAVGAWPGLAEADLYDRRDLMPMADVRAMAAWVMRGLFGLDKTALTNTVFPNLDMGDDPGLVL